MRIKIKEKVAFGGTRHLPGEVLEVDEATGAHLITHQLVERIEERPATGAAETTPVVEMTPVEEKLTVAEELSETEKPAIGEKPVRRPLGGKRR